MILSGQPAQLSSDPLGGLRESQSFEKVPRRNDGHAAPAGCIEEVSVSRDDEGIRRLGTSHELVVCRARGDRLLALPICNERGVSRERSEYFSVLETWVRIGKPITGA